MDALKEHLKLTLITALVLLASFALINVIEAI